MKKRLILLLELFPIVAFAGNTWIGNGSIMSAYSGIVSDKQHEGPYPFGVTKDMTKLQKTYFNKNVAFFQWFIKKDSCEHLKIYTKSNKQKVDITIGNWSGRSSDRTFENVSLPFIIGKENVGVDNIFSDRSWVVTAIKLKDTTNSEGLYAECTTQPVTNISPSIIDGSNIIVDGYKWQGNGSIISGYFELQSNQPSYGIFKDISIFHANTNKQVVFFQWLRSEECPNLQIDILNNYDEDGNLIDIVPDSKKDVKIVSKSWEESLSDATTQNVHLPYILKGDNKLWTVLGVYSDSLFDKSYRVEAKCTKKTKIEYTNDSNDNNDYSEVNSKVLSFLSTYFTLTDNQRALNIIKHLSNLNILYDYISGLEDYTDPTEEVLYSLEFFLRNSPDVFGGSYIPEGAIVKAYKQMQEYYDTLSQVAGVTQHLYIDVEEDGILYDPDIKDAEVTIYAITQYNPESEEYEVIDTENSNYFSYKGKYIGGIYGYSFDKEVVSGMYLLEIIANGKKHLETIFVPLKNQYFINIVLDD